MQHFSLSVCNYIKAQVERYKSKGDTGNALIVLPSLPAGVMNEIGRLLEAQVMPQVDRFVYKIAKPLWEEWETDGDSRIKELVDQARKKGWLDDLGNLTYYRNEGVGVHDETAAMILGGMDHVTDAGSLADFHRCTIQTIWEWPQGMNTRFEDWVKDCLKNIAYEDETPEHFDEVFKALLTRVPTDILRISEFLDQLDLSGVHDGRDAEQALLSGLDFFNLPDLTAYKFGGRQKFASYVDAALSFFSYGMFLEDRARNNAVKAVKAYQKKKAKDNSLFENEQIGQFQSDDEFLDALADYIENGGSEKHDELMDCDFALIKDKVLKYKGGKTAPTADGKESVKKLGTDPLESVLTGIWLTLGKFRTQSEKAGSIAHDVLTRIRIKSFLFKHDSEGGNQEEKNEAARNNLKKCLSIYCQR